MLNNDLVQTKVAVLASSKKHGRRLQTLLEGVGLAVVIGEAGNGLLQQLEEAGVDVLLVDFSEPFGFFRLIFLKELGFEAVFNLFHLALQVFARRNRVE